MAASAQNSARKSRATASRATGGLSSLRTGHTLSSFLGRSQQPSDFESGSRIDDPLSLMNDETRAYFSSALQTPLRGARQDANASLMAANEAMLLGSPQESDAPGIFFAPNADVPINERLAKLMRTRCTSEFERAAAITEELRRTLRLRESQIKREENDQWTSEGVLRETMQEEIATLRHERNTWMLMRTVFHLYVENKEDSGTINMLERTEFAPSEKTLMDLAAEETLALRQAHGVAQWLMAVAGQDRRDTAADAFGSFDSGYSWVNTQEALESSKRGYVQSQAAAPQLVPSLDPDAPLRTGKALHSFDVDAERALFARLFRLVRSDRLAEARDLCTSVGQAWRAASLLGNEPHHYDTVGSDEASGCLHRSLWRTAAVALCETRELGIHERALYATVSAYLPPLLDAAVCSSWSDALWAHATVFVRAKAEARAAAFSKSEIPSDLSDFAQLTLADLFDRVNHSPQANVREDAQHPIHQLQRLLILNDIPAVLRQMADWVASEQLPHFHRLFAHLVLFLRQVVPAEIDVTNAEVVLQGFANQLVARNDFACVATYTVELQNNKHVSFYSTFAARSTTRDARQQALRLADQVHMRVLDIATSIVADSIKENASGALSDSSLVNALEWLLFTPTHLPFALFYANKIIRRFLGADKFELARQAASMVNAAEIPIAGELPFHISDVEDEFQAHLVLLDAEEAYVAWSIHFAERPAEARLATHWKLVADRNSAKSDRALVMLLQHPAGWLCGLIQPDAPHELATLRRKFIPRALQQLHTVRHQSGQFREAVQIATLAVSEQHHVLAVMRDSPAELRVLLDFIRQSALKNVEGTGNSLGR